MPDKDHIYGSYCISDTPPVHPRLHLFQCHPRPDRNPWSSLPVEPRLPEGHRDRSCEQEALSSCSPLIFPRGEARYFRQLEASYILKIQTCSDFRQMQSLQVGSSFPAALLTPCPALRSSDNPRPLPESAWTSLRFSLRAPRYLHSASGRNPPCR